MQKPSSILTLVTGLVLLGISLNSSLLRADQYQADSHYKVLDADQSITIQSQPEVIEFFYYGCPHCNNALPHVERWLKNKPPQVQFSRVAVFFSERWQWSTYLYSVAQSLGVVDKVHSKIFDKQFNAGGIRSQQDIFAIFATAGISQKQVEDAYASFAVKNRVQKAGVHSQKSGIQGTPSFMVKGKYLVTPGLAGSYEKMFDIINFLLRK